MATSPHFIDLGSPQVIQSLQGHWK